MNRIMRRLLILLIIALVIVVSYFASQDIPELFRGGGAIFDFIERLAEAYIAAFIFFYVVQYMYFSKRKKLAEESLDIILYRISYNMSELMRLLLFGIGEHIKQENEILNFDTDILDNKRFNYSEKNIGSFFIGSKLMIFQDSSPEQIFHMIVNSINMNVNRLDKYLEFYSEDLVEILLDIRNSDLLESISIAPNHKMLEKILNTRVDEIKTFYAIYQELIKYMKDNNIPTESKELLIRHSKMRV